MINARATQLRERESAALDAVHSFIGDADRICLDRALRIYRNAVRATVRYEIDNAPR